MGFFAPVRQDEYPATDELQCIAVKIPAGDEYKALLAGFVAFLTNVDSYLDPDSVQADGIAAVFDEGYAQTNWDGCGIPPECNEMNSFLMLLPDMAIVSSGAAITWVADTGSSLGGYFTQSPALTGDTYYWEEYLAGGAYSWNITYLQNTNNGKSDFKVFDPLGNPQGAINIDMRGSLVRNAKQGSNFDNPVSGKCRFEWVGNGSTGAGFIRTIQRVVIYKTGEL